MKKQSKQIRSDERQKDRGTERPKNQEAEKRIEENERRKERPKGMKKERKNNYILKGRIGDEHTSRSKERNNEETETYQAKEQMHSMQITENLNNYKSTRERHKYINEQRNESINTDT